MVKIEKKDVELFCFDVLGDFMDPEAYEIIEKADGFEVVVKDHSKIYAPTDMVYEDWYNAIQYNDNMKNVTLKI